MLPKGKKYTERYPRRIILMPLLPIPLLLISLPTPLQIISFFVFLFTLPVFLFVKVNKYVLFKNFLFSLTQRVIYYIYMLFGTLIFSHLTISLGNHSTSVHRDLSYTYFYSYIAFHYGECTIVYSNNHLL